MARVAQLGLLAVTLLGCHELLSYRALPGDGTPIDLGADLASTSDARSDASQPVDAAPVDAMQVDAAPVDAAPVDAAPVDAAPVDVGVDAGLAPTALWVSVDNELHRYLLSPGSLTLDTKESIPFPGPGGRPTTERARGLADLGGGAVAVYNGTFAPQLSIRDAAGQWQHHDHSVAGWSTVSNVSYGGVAADATTIYATDMATAGAPASGLVAVSRSDPGTLARPVSGVDLIDVTAGLDGVVYMLDPSAVISRLGSSSTISIGADVRGVAVGADGRVLALTWDGKLLVHTGGASTVAPLPLSQGVDIALAADDVTVAVGTAAGQVWIGDEQGTGFSTSVGTSAAFVAFASDAP